MTAPRAGLVSNVGELAPRPDGLEHLGGKLVGWIQVLHRPTPHQGKGLAGGQLLQGGPVNRIQVGVDPDQKPVGIGQRVQVRQKLSRLQGRTEQTGLGGDNDKEVPQQVPDLIDRQRQLVRGRRLVPGREVHQVSVALAVAGDEGQHEGTAGPRIQGQAHLHPQQGLDSRLTSGIIEVDHPVENVFIRQGQGRVPPLTGGLHQVRDLDGALQQAK